MARFQLCEFKCKNRVLKGPLKQDNLDNGAGYPSIRQMTKQEKLAAHLLNLYWTGAGDAGTDRTIFSFHETIPLTEAEAQKALVDGKSCTMVYAGKRVTQTEYFVTLASLMLVDIGVPLTT